MHDTETISVSTIRRTARLVVADPGPAQLRPPHGGGGQSLKRDPPGRNRSIALIAPSLIAAIIAATPETARMVDHWLHRQHRTERKQLENFERALVRRLDADEDFATAIEDGQRFGSIEDRWSAFSKARDEYERSSKMGMSSLTERMSESERDAFREVAQNYLGPSIATADRCLQRAEAYVVRQHTPTGRHHRWVLMRRAANTLDRCVSLPNNSNVAYFTAHAYIVRCAYSLNSSIDIALAGGPGTSLRTASLASELPALKAACTPLGLYTATAGRKPVASR